jgi:hypothetical protein
VVQSSAIRQGFRRSGEAGVLSRASETEPRWHWSEATAEASVDIVRFLSSAYLEYCREYLRLHRETYPFALPLSHLDTWEDVEIRGLRTSELNFRGIRREVPTAYLVLLWQYLRSHDPVAHVFRGDPSVWVCQKYAEPTTASEDEYPEWDWIQANEARLREKYAGLWIAVKENGMVAVAGSEVEVLKQADESGYADVFTFYVPTGSEPAVVVVAA